MKNLTIRGEMINDEYSNLDLYYIEEFTGANTSEISIVINHDLGLIAGDKIAYGGWFDLTEEEIFEYLELIRENGELLREVPQNQTYLALRVKKKLNQIIEKQKSGILDQLKVSYDECEIYTSLEEYIDWLLFNRDCDYEIFEESLELLRLKSQLRLISCDNHIYVFLNKERENLSFLFSEQTCSVERSVL